ncbi:Cof-type HAD-IIB family hydrolase [Flavobacterium algoritolerans]|uniref:Cof-type HAD-IIB family hydrolase n=1 Tax=Flavobacterium algoritolerans TaxID=3041254 RepID=A0ABT6VDN1_9FLAO|nr:Cof-type HAD-IIB family hydrolase [Flavobacterium algoritolerans]MDI5896348.1 Cof-type HAD-IIB family hydrolase [Flavobacterium algoritolerans]
MILKEKIKVVISDLDGTLLNSDHKISQYTKTVFQELHNQNYLIIVATGRHHLDAMPIVAGLNVPLYLVTSNGARIHSPEKELLFSFNMESDAVKSVLSLDIDPEITTVLFRENVWQTNKNNEKLNKFQPEVNYHPELVDFDSLEDLSAIKVFFTHEKHSKLIELRDQILENHMGLFSHAFSLPLCLEFMDKSVDKSVAIAKILEKENFVFQEAISFGDGYNDENMLKSSGKGLVMGNAPDSLKDKLSHLEVISTNDNEGVAKYIAEQLLNS